MAASQGEMYKNISQCSSISCSSRTEARFVVVVCVCLLCVYFCVCVVNAINSNQHSKYGETYLAPLPPPLARSDMYLPFLLYSLKCIVLPICTTGSSRDIKTAVWNLAGFLHCALEPRWQRFGQFSDFLHDFLYENLDFLHETFNDFLHDFLEGGPEPLENEISKMLCSKREDRSSDHFSDLVQNICSVRFSYLLRLSIFCKAPRDMRKFPQKCQKIAGC